MRKRNFFLADIADFFKERFLFQIFSGQISKFADDVKNEAFESAIFRKTSNIQKLLKKIATDCFSRALPVALNGGRFDKFRRRKILSKEKFSQNLSLPLNDRFFKSQIFKDFAD